MAFPSNPSNGDTHTAGSITYIYDSTPGVWKVQTFDTVNASEALTKIKTVDGASSGLDADLLDGQSSAYYLSYDNLTNLPDTVGAAEDVFWENAQTLSTSYTITTNKNALTAGPLTIASGVTATIPSGSRWVIV